MADITQHLIHINDALRRVERKIDTQMAEFAEFKEVCHSRQNKCRSELHTRINEVKSGVDVLRGKTNGIHARDGEKIPHAHQRSVVNQFKDYWPYVLLFMAVGAVLRSEVVEPALKRLFGG